jgi:hypothetical protein
MNGAGTQGGPFSPSSFAYEISATSGSVNYSVTNLPSWLAVSSKSGTVSTSAKPIIFSLKSTADKLQPNIYSDNVDFNNTTNQLGSTTHVATLFVFTKTYTIMVSASPSADGTVSGAGAFSAGSSRAVTATPNSGVAFVQWTESGMSVSSCPSYTLTLNSNVNLIAEFLTAKTHTITVSVSPGADGTVTCGGTFAAGSLRTVTATPNSGHTFVHWTEDGNVVSASASYTFRLNSDVTLVAEFN